MPAEASQHRYLTLDGIRGVAAMLVFVSHANPLLFDGPFHFYLAVDLFFMLSGFVLGTTYDRSLENGALSSGAFIKIRLMRLYPLFFLASVIGLIASLLAVTYGGGHMSYLATWLPGQPLPVVAASFLFSLLMLPSVYSPVLYPLNGPAWSLFYEWVINILYALIRPRWSLSIIALIMLLCAIAAAPCAYIHHGFTAGLFWRGMPESLVRAAYCFAAGLLLVEARRRWAPRFIILHSSLGVLGVLCVAALALAMPTQTLVDPFYDAFAIFVLFPLIILTGSCVEPGRRGAQICTVLGKSSYGVYILHVPLSALVAIGYMEMFHAKISLMASIPLFPCLMLLSYILDAVYEQPLRRFFRRRFQP